MSVCADLRDRTQYPGAYVPEDFRDLPSTVASQYLSRLARQGWLEHQGRVYVRPPADDEAIVTAVLRKLGQIPFLAARDAALEQLLVEPADGRRAAVLVGGAAHRFEATLPDGWSLVVRDQGRNQISVHGNIILEALRWKDHWPVGQEAEIRARIRRWLRLMEPDDIAPALGAEPAAVRHELRQFFEEVGWDSGLAGQAEKGPRRVRQVTLRGVA